MNPKSEMPGIFSMLMDLVKSNEQEEVRGIEEQIDEIEISDESEEDENDLDIILEENILEEKIKDLNMNKNERDDITDLIGLPKEKVTDYDEKLKVIETALHQNRQLKKKLQALECELLLLKRDLDRNVESSSVNNTVEKTQNLDFYTSFTAPYFKYKGFPCPVNSDQSAKERIKPSLYEASDFINSWEEDELHVFEQSIRDTLVQEYFYSLEEEHSNVKYEHDSDHKIKVINEVSFIRSADLSEVFKKYNENSLDWDKISRNLYNSHSGRDCKLMWDLYLKPSIRKDKWTKKEEIAILKAAKKFDYQDWDKIALDLSSNRTGYQCFSRYQQHLCKISKKWSEEDLKHFRMVLRLAKQGESINWSRIKYFIDDSNFITLYNKWYKTRCFSDEEMRKGKFNPKEDKFILSAVKEGIPLQRIHHFLQSRNSCQIRERYINYLDDSLKNRKYGIWTLEEDALLVKLIKEYGEGQWATIAKHFASRSRTQIRQHYENLKKIILKNPNIDFEKIKRRKNIYSKKRPLKRLTKDIKTNDKNLKFISTETDFAKDKEDMELIRHFVYKKSVFKGRQSIRNTFTNNSEAILKVCEDLNIQLSDKVSGFGVNEYRKHLHEFIFGSIQFVKKIKELPTHREKNNFNDSLNLYPPNILTISSLRNILSRLEVEKANSCKKSIAESNIHKSKGDEYKDAVENWCKRMFMLFSSTYILEGIDSEQFKKKDKSTENN
ncbi:snRNA-activating protein complex subunit 4 [Halyomorpha halys]|uniref:snRNA-activating protein complex subunit 4 n=1 Tax=Halyomorpha halys TaxID=286706 RepID=UPI0006D4FA61|nr:snRNA-activating protein complex subunit 4-like [Halyomorpha halys]